MTGRKPALTEEDCSEIRRMYSVKVKGWTVPQIARCFSVSTGTINKVLNNDYSPRQSEAESCSKLLLNMDAQRLGRVEGRRKERDNRPLVWPFGWA